MCKTVIRANMPWLSERDVEEFCNDVKWKVGRLRLCSTSGKILASLRHPENISWKSGVVKRVGICEKCVWCRVCGEVVEGVEWRIPYNGTCRWHRPGVWRIPEI